MKYVVTYRVVPDDEQKTIRVVADNEDMAKSRTFELDDKAYSVDSIVIDGAFYDNHGMSEKTQTSEGNGRLYRELQSISSKLTALIEIQKELVKYLAQSADDD
jgi:hypothetical protein